MMLFDTSVLIDARDASSLWHHWAKEQIAEAVASEGACANTVVVSETATRDPKRIATYFPKVSLVTPDGPAGLGLG
jgi:hypothetical protein